MNKLKTIALTILGALGAFLMLIIQSKNRKIALHHYRFYLHMLPRIKDEFVNIKNVIRDDILAAHRIPPELLSIMPSNTGGFGNVKERAAVYYINEMIPLINRSMGINGKLGLELFKFMYKLQLILSDLL